MLKNIDPLLNADVLYALCAMGHGDDLVLCDTNFPADSVARQTVLGRLLRIDGISAARAARAILSVFPLDTFVDDAALRMEVVGSPDEVPPVQVEVQREIDRAEGKPRPMGSIERFAFYERSKQAYCVLATGESRFYGCFVFKKGVTPRLEWRCADRLVRSPSATGGWVDSRSSSKRLQWLSATKLRSVARPWIRRSSDQLRREPGPGGGEARADAGVW